MDFNPFFLKIHTLLLSQSDKIILNVLKIIYHILIFWYSQNMTSPTECIPSCILLCYKQFSSLNLSTVYSNHASYAYFHLHCFVAWSYYYNVGIIKWRQQGKLPLGKVSKTSRRGTHIYLFIAPLGPTWEFQPCLKSFNLASWTTKWNDSARGTGHPPQGCVEGIKF